MTGPPEDGAQARIVLAAIETIEAEGPERATVRRIAKRAGVNVAAINYYFGTKQRLMELVVERAVHTGFRGQFDEIQESGEDLQPLAFVERYFELTLEGIQRYRGLTRFLLHGALMGGDPDPRVVEMMRSGLEEVFAYLRRTDAFVHLDEEAGRVVLIQVMNAVLVAGLSPDMVVPFLGYSLEDPSGRHRFVASLLRSHLRRP